MKKIKFFSWIMAFITLLSLTLFSVTACEKSYEVSNAYFTPARFQRNIRNVAGQNDEKEYVLICTSSCSVSLYEYTAEVKVYSDANALLKNQTVNKSEEIEANTKFSFEVVVSQQILNATSSVDVVFEGKSKDKIQTVEQKYKVTFVYNNGKPDFQTLIEKGKTVPTPNVPKKNNYIFNDWYTDSAFLNRYDFSKAVTQDVVLYAKYDIDAVSLTNKISTDTIKGVVKIYNKSYNTFLGFETSYSTSQGSGFCFHIQDGYYYVLTNCHVAVLEDSYDKQKFTIEDYQGNTYEGHLYKNPNKSVKAIAASYDLACLYFKPSSTNVKELPLISTNPSVKDDIISIGAPKGQSNSITYGKISKYEKITLSDATPSESDVKFEVICHNAYANNGSSGGPLLNANLEVVGVHYAGNQSANKEYAIPVEKVKEFLKNYVYN